MKKFRLVTLGVILLMGVSMVSYVPSSLAADRELVSSAESDVSARRPEGIPKPTITYEADLAAPVDKEIYVEVTVENYTAYDLFNLTIQTIFDPDGGNGWAMKCVVPGSDGKCNGTTWTETFGYVPIGFYDVYTIKVILTDEAMIGDLQTNLMTYAVWNSGSMEIPADLEVTATLSVEYFAPPVAAPGVPIPVSVEVENTSAVDADDVSILSAFSPDLPDHKMVCYPGFLELNHKSLFPSSYPFSIASTCDWLSWTEYVGDLDAGESATYKMYVMLTGGAMQGTTQESAGTYGKWDGGDYVWFGGQPISMVASARVD